MDHKLVDREFTFDEALQAFAHMSEQRHFGKLVINVAGARPPEFTPTQRWDELQGILANS